MDPLSLWGQLATSYRPIAQCELKTALTVLGLNNLAF